jgi:hypothetical protein
MVIGSKGCIRPAETAEAYHGTWLGTVHRCRGPVAYPRGPLAGHRGAASPTPQYPSLRRPAAQIRPRLHGSHSVRLADRLPVESLGCHPLLSRLDGARPLPRMGPSRRLSQDVGGGPDGLRRRRGHRLGLAEYGRVHDQGAPRGGKRRARTPPIVPSKGSSAACWWRRTASRSVWPWTAPTATT